MFGIFSSPTPQPGTPNQPVSTASTTTEKASPPPSRTRNASTLNLQSAIPTTPVSSQLFVDTDSISSHSQAHTRLTSSEFDSDEEFVALFDEVPRLTSQFHSSNHRFSPARRNGEPSSNTATITTTTTTTNKPGRMRKTSPGKQWAGGVPTTGYGALGGLDRQSQISNQYHVGESSESTGLLAARRGTYRSAPLNGLRETTRMVGLASAVASGSAGGRLVSLDLFRGATVGLMIIANYQFGQRAFGWLRHAEWEGCSFVDLVFPTFLFILGVVCIRILQLF
ncbi:hypothetical protein HK096_002617 [Nowakowskiella sp. JEL0078]|nr:hypothetical protein HK096_002617 [Nowakowskiella sp. JEL0078]